MAFVVPQHLPRAAFGQGSSYGSSTSHSEPVLRKLAETTRDSLTSTETSKWVEEIRKILKIQRCIHKDLPAFERQLASADQVQEALGELTSGADDITNQVQRPQTGLLPTVLATLSAHSTLAQGTQDAKVLQMHFEGGNLPAVRKSEEAQSLIQSSPRPLESSAVMKNLSRMARVLGDRVQEQLGDAYSRGVAITAFPSGATVAILPHINVRDSNNSVTLSELLASLQESSLKEHLSTFRKDVLVRALEPVLVKPSRLILSTQEATLTIDHSPGASDASSPIQQAQEALQNTRSLITFIHDMLLPALPAKDIFAIQLAGPISQALVKHVLRASIPRSGSLRDIPDFLRVTEQAAKVEGELFAMGFRSGDVREWTQAAPLHYERLRREDLVQQARGAVLEHDGTAVVVTRTVSREEEKNRLSHDEAEDDPWAFEEPTPAVAQSVPIIATPAPKPQPQPAPSPIGHSEATPAPLHSTDDKFGEPSKPTSPPPEDAEEDGWGFDDEELDTTQPQKITDSAPGPESSRGDTSEDEHDVEVYARTSQSEAEASERSGGTSHPTELLSAPQSDAEIVNATTQSSEESDPWDDDPWGESGEETKVESESVSIQSSELPAPTHSPTRAPGQSQSKPVSPIARASPPAVVEVPPSPAAKAPARVARGLERFAQKNPSFPPASAFGTAPSSAFPTSAVGHASPSKPNQSLPGPNSTAAFSPPEPPKIAPPVTPAMRRAQQQSKSTTPKHGKSVSGYSASPLGSPTKKWNALPQDDLSSSVGSISGLFGPDSNQRRYAGSEVGSQIGSVVGSQVGGGSQVGVGSQVGTFTSAISPEQPTPAPGLAAKQEPVTETYMVSTKAQRILALAEDALKEGKELVLSNVFPRDTTPIPGALVLGCIPSFFDLFRALVPVAHGGPMAASAGIAMRFSNDCAVGEGVRPKLQEVKEKLKVFGESWFEEVLDNEKLAISKYLESAEGFRNIHDQARYQECRRAVTRCTHAVSKFSRDTKPVLSFAKYHLALGTLVEDTESHRLHEICKLMHTFESLFVPDGESTSTVSQYVASWFKYSYLSELLEASLADIRHLFDIGALVDFSEQDLAHLIRALFSDSPKRQELIERVLAGHPAQP
ncbi:Centromere/kinetochore Zw10 [Rhizoctonia solani]|uniref:Centromere/kinetochore Zw10 n=1 Tax=Rhizoctonia solani TaxID=456999 RepID=A0A8H7IF50_9AGAM|nr:Centromere/kinetochore Zw10 [Rhizoctonia solani]